MPSHVSNICAAEALGFKHTVLQRRHLGRSRYYMLV